MSLLIDENKLAAKILQAMLNHVNAAVQRSITPIQNRVADYVEAAIKSSSAYNSLVNGSLKGEMGLKSPQSILDRVVAKIREDISVTFKRFTYSGGQISGNLSVGIIKSDYSDLTSIDGASYTSSTSGASYDIPWLEYLLTKGDQILILDHHIVFTTNQKSRSGQAVMVPTGIWRVPPEFSGIAGDNFLTRALDDAAKVISKIVSEEIKRVIR